MPSNDPRMAGPEELREQYSLAIPEPSYLRPDDEIDDTDEIPVDGWVITRPISMFWREFFNGGHGRWFKCKAAWRNGVLRTEHPQVASVYDDRETALRTMAEVDDTGTAVVAAIPRLRPEEEQVREDRAMRGR